MAWMFKNPDGSVKFVLDDRSRAEAWGRHFDGEVIPLVPANAPDTADQLPDFLADKLDAANEQIERLRAERDYALKCLRMMADVDRDVRDMEEATKYYEEMAIRLRKSLKELTSNAN